MKAIIKKILFNCLPLYWLYTQIRFEIPGKLLGERWDIAETKRKYKKAFGRRIDLVEPKTLNEKIQWLKLNLREDFHTQCADKLASREIWKEYGEDGLVPLLYQTEDWRELTMEKIPDVPCVVKCNTGSGAYRIIRDRSQMNIKKLRRECHRWMIGNFYYRTQEWQYKNIKPCIIIEQLLQDKNGHIPNDYKLHFINGELQFIYCSVDREGANYRSIYSPDWKRLNMEWVAKKAHKGGLVGKDIPQPMTFERMKEIGADIAKRFQYVRVDFYEVEGKMYYGEITLHHGSGFDTFEPEFWDRYYGDKLILGGG